MIGKKAIAIYVELDICIDVLEKAKVSKGLSPELLDVVLTKLRCIATEVYDILEAIAGRKEQGKYAPFEFNGDKYSAFNESGNYTVEFRLFQATTDKLEALRYFQFVKSLLEWSEVDTEQEYWDWLLWSTDYRYGLVKEAITGV